jgi:KUP system potassium uptake protein
MKDSMIKKCAELIKPLGIVFGDIGTSPIYTLSAIFFSGISPTTEHIMGICSLIVWTLILLVFVEYSWLAMSLSKKGEGGTIVLKEILLPLARSKKVAGIATILSFVGISLFFGDGVITPAVSILSAAEGLQFIPLFGNIYPWIPTLLAAIICILLFSVQARGTEKISVAFGPLMFLWFLVLMFFGILSIIEAPLILRALLPSYGIHFLMEYGWASVLVLSGVILCATGGEALYADMGHLGRIPIVRSWNFVFCSLICAYLGQGAFLMAHPDAMQHTGANIFYEMLLYHAPFWFAPLVILSICATVIASQALITGIFSVVYQSITTHIMPMFKVDYTSMRMRSQVYIGFVNWLLLVFVLLMIFVFKTSLRLADAYGLAVTGTMMVTGVLMVLIFYLRRHWWKFLLGVFLTSINTVFFVSSLFKLPAGAYWSVIIALFPFIIIMIYTNGQKRLYKALHVISLEDFIKQFIVWHESATLRLKGSALFFVRNIQQIPPYVLQTIFKNNILYEDTIIISVITRDEPFGIVGFFRSELVQDGLRIFEIHRGYMEILDIENVLRNANIDAQVMFYGLEDISSNRLIWKTYSVIKRLTPSFVQFYKLPQYKLHGVVYSVHM